MDLYNLLELGAVIGLIISSIGILYEKKKNPKIKYPTAIPIILILALIGLIIVFYY